jgi:transposase
VGDAVAVKQYSVDLRERLLRAIDAGLSQAEAARLFGVGTATIARWRQRQREHGSVAPQPRPGRPRRIGRTQERALLAQVRALPDATLREHCAQWEAEQGVRLSETTMSHALARLGWPLKKSRSKPVNGMTPSVPTGGPTWPRSTPPASSSSMRVAPTPP